MSIKTARSIPANQAKVGQWLAYHNERMNQRIVGVAVTKNNQVKIHADFGNGGEPATLFFEPDENILVL
jgi:hypothetical protein